MNIPLPTENMLAKIDGPIGWMIFNKPAAAMRCRWICGTRFLGFSTISSGIRRFG